MCLPGTRLARPRAKLTSNTRSESCFYIFIYICIRYFWSLVFFFAQNLSARRLRVDTASLEHHTQGRTAIFLSVSRADWCQVGASSKQMRPTSAWRCRKFTRTASVRPLRAPTLCERCEIGIRGILGYNCDERANGHSRIMRAARWTQES